MSSISLQTSRNVSLLKGNDRNSREGYNICFKLIIKASKRRQWRRSGVFILNFEYISVIFLVFLLLNLNKQMFFFYTNIYILSGKNYNHQVYTYKCCDITGNKKREILNVCWEICKNCALPRKNNCWTLHIGWISVATVHVFRYRKLIPECSLNRRVFPNVSNYWRKPLITFIAKLFGYAKN